MESQLPSSEGKLTSALANSGRRLLRRLGFRGRDPALAARQQRLATAGLLAAGVAHDLNNLLTLLGASLENLAAGVQAPHASPVAAARLACERARDLSRRLVRAARDPHGAPVFAPVNLSALAEEVASLVRPSLSPNVALAVHPESERVFALGDPLEIYQAVLNLCVNAAQAADERGTIDVLVHWVQSPWDENASDLRPSAKLVVRDCGPGISPALLPRGAQPFATRRPGGSGLGLAIVRAMAERHGARVAIASELGRGTTVELHFPPAGGEA